MKEFLDSISTPYWWISVVLVGVLINLVSHYAQKNLDKQLSGISSRWKNYSEAQKSKRLAEIKRLRNNQNEQVFLAFTEMRYRIWTVFFTLASLVLVVFFLVIESLRERISILGVGATYLSYIVSLFLFILSAASMFVVAVTHQSASNMRDLLEESRQNTEQQDGLSKDNEVS